MQFSSYFSKTSAKMMVIAALAIGVSSSVFAGDQGTSIVTALKNSEASDNVALNAGHAKHDTNGDGVDDHMAGKNGNGYGHGGHGGSGGNGNGGDGGAPQCVPEPASMLAMGLGAGFIALRRRRATKKA